MEQTEIDGLEKLKGNMWDIMNDKSGKWTPKAKEDAAKEINRIEAKLGQKITDFAILKPMTGPVPPDQSRYVLKIQACNAFEEWYREKFKLPPSDMVMATIWVNS